MADVVDERRGQMFPKLDEVQLARIAAHAEKRAIRKGEVLFDQGTVSPGVFILLSGSL